MPCLVPPVIEIARLRLSMNFVSFYLPFQLAATESAWLDLSTLDCHFRLPLTCSSLSSTEMWMRMSRSDGFCYNFRLVARPLHIEYPSSFLKEFDLCRARSGWSDPPMFLRWRQRLIINDVSVQHQPKSANSDLFFTHSGDEQVPKKRQLSPPIAKCH